MRIVKRFGVTLSLVGALTVAGIFGVRSADAWVTGPASTHTFVLNYTVSGQYANGTGSCTIGSSIGPSGTTVGSTTLGQAVRSESFVKNCVGTSGPDNLWSYAKGICNASDSYIGGFSPPPPTTDAYCDVQNSATQSYTSFDTSTYSGNYEADLSVNTGCNCTFTMTNSVPGCTQVLSIEVKCTWSSSFRGQNPL